MISRQLLCLPSAPEDSRAALPVTLGFHHAQLLSSSGVVCGLVPAAWGGPADFPTCPSGGAALLKGSACAGSSCAFICPVLWLEE